MHLNYGTQGTKTIQGQATACSTTYTVSGVCHGLAGGQAVLLPMFYLPPPPFLSQRPMLTWGLPASMSLSASSHWSNLGNGSLNDTMTVSFLTVLVNHPCHPVPPSPPNICIYFIFLTPPSYYTNGFQDDSGVCLEGVDLKGVMKGLTDPSLVWCFRAHMEKARKKTLCFLWGSSGELVIFWNDSRKLANWLKKPLFIISDGKGR